jgi:hypothetical protein
MVSINGASAIVSLYPAVVNLTNQINTVNTLIADNALITGGNISAYDGQVNIGYSQPLMPLSSSESATVLTTMSTILATRWSAASAALAAAV